SSINGMVPFPNNGPYNSAKFALRGFNKTLIQELRGSSVNITSVHPGGVKTNITRNMRFYKHVDQNLKHTELIDGFDKLAQTTADRAARIIISGIKKNKKRLLVGADAKFMDFMSRMFPLLTTRITGILTKPTIGR
ncbi:MAG: SDR family NAD(P)-dependent oxidoreductase, partial [Desulfobacterales bacterium]|nr:SDR family NAD(P)-dependent oxidoreductase [Desulfobacterales bacterium]